VMKYIKDFYQMVSYAYAVREGRADISDEALSSIQKDMVEKDVYHPRFGKPSVHTIKFKVCQIVLYMFGYKISKSKEQRIVFSPLGNLLLDNIKEIKKVSRIFLSMLFSIQFAHPFNHMKSEFSIYPYRLIFTLLLDHRLKERLYHDEVFYYVMFVKKIDKISYEQLIKDILNFRQMSPTEKYNLFKINEHVLANALHEWNYATGMLEQAGIVIKKNDDNNNNYGVLVHGKGIKKSGRRRYKLDYIIVNSDVKNFTDILVKNYPYYADLVDSSGKDKKMHSENIVQMYSFYPDELIKELGIETEEQRKISIILKITDRINEYARNEGNVHYRQFEEVLCEAFNLFKDVRAEIQAKSGTTDIECLYYPDAKPIIKFDVEAKSRKIKLQEISSGRLRSHREKIGSKYTVIVTPEYSQAVLEDIKYSDAVILLSRTLSNFLYQFMTKYGRNISYDIIHDIVENNLGVDITNKVNDYIYKYFSIKAV
jgi:hypothetical protein